MFRRKVRLHTLCSTLCGRSSGLHQIAYQSLSIKIVADPLPVSLRSSADCQAHVLEKGCDSISDRVDKSEPFSDERYSRFDRLFDHSDKPKSCRLNQSSRCKIHVAACREQRILELICPVKNRNFLSAKTPVVLPLQPPKPLHPRTGKVHKKTRCQMQRVFLINKRYLLTI